MNAIRNVATGASRGNIINVVYVVAFLVALYYVYKFLIAGSELEVVALDSEVPANVAKVLPLSDGPNGKVRIKTGGEYTLSFWMYITSWDQRAGQYKAVLRAVNTGAQGTTTPTESMVTIMMHPNDTKMMIRVRTNDTNSSMGGDITTASGFDGKMGSSVGADVESGNLDAPMCDIQDIDLHRWINITINVNGRIVDVYYDGKLSRSCVLSGTPTTPDSGLQQIFIGEKGGFGGKISGVQFFAYSLTPDRIYSIYQAGPTAAAGFMGYMAEKVGIKLNYSGAGGLLKTF